jgi:hypothetical protein
MPKRTNNNDASRGRWWCALQGMGSVDRRWSEGGATMNRHILKRKGGPVGSYMSNGGGGGFRLPTMASGARGRATVAQQWHGSDERGWAAASRVARQGSETKGLTYGPPWWFK